VKLTEEDVRKFSDDLSRIIQDALSVENRSRVRSLRMSNLGIACDRRLWLEINRPETVEPLTAPVRMKFLFGSVIESLVLLLAELAGHSVQGSQDEMSIDGVLGHRDAVIDGTTIDVKSASSYSMDKFRYGLKPETDSFGYLDQIGSYLWAGQDDPVVTDKDHAGFVAVDKTLGNIVLDLHKKTNKDYIKHVKDKRDAIESPSIPSRHYSDVPMGASGNRKLGTACSYCPVKRACWPGLREFQYSNGPVYLTKVVKEPNVSEK
jgi:hypothetical protein